MRFDLSTSWIRRLPVWRLFGLALIAAAVLSPMVLAKMHRLPVRHDHGVVLAYVTLALAVLALCSGLTMSFLGRAIRRPAAALLLSATVALIVTSLWLLMLSRVPVQATFWSPVGILKEALFVYRRTIAVGVALVVLVYVRRWMKVDIEPVALGSFRWDFFIVLIWAFDGMLHLHWIFFHAHGHPWASWLVLVNFNFVVTCLGLVLAAILAATLRALHPVGSRGLFVALIATATVLLDWAIMLAAAAQFAALEGAAK